MSLLIDITSGDISSRLKYDINVYNTILEKVENDGHFISMFENFRSIFEKEIHYAFKGQLTRVEKSSADE